MAVAEVVMQDTTHLIPSGTGRWRVRVPVGGKRIGLGTHEYDKAIQIRDEALGLVTMEEKVSDGWTATGVFTEDDGETEDQVLERARRESMLCRLKYAKTQAQEIKFDGERVCIVALGDQHLGGAGVDIERLFDEAQMVADTPNCYAILVGDTLNNFIIKELRHARADSRITIKDEWKLVRKYLRILAKKILIVVGGNHEIWVELLADIPYFREVVASIAPSALYDSDEVLATITCGNYSEPWKVRHIWAGSSKFNPSYAIEQSAYQNHDFRVGIGGHNHAGGVVRSFFVGGEQHLAGMVGTYKRFDPYARKNGFPHPGPYTAIGFVIDGNDGTVQGYDDINLAIKGMLQ